MTVIPGRRPSPQEQINDALERIGNLERARAASGSSGAFIVGSVFNDAGIISGTGFTIDWSREDGSSPNSNFYTVRFTVPFFNPPITIVSPNNNNPVALPGEYGVSTRLVNVSWVEVMVLGFDTTVSDGGFNFVAFEPGT